MRSAFRFCMHPDDEREFVAELRREPGLRLVDDSIWPSPEPPLLESLDPITKPSVVLIWNSQEAPGLSAEFRKAGVWGCDNAFLALQWIRSRIAENVVTVGRLGVSTSGVGDEAFARDVAPGLERRYQRLRRWLKKRYRNRVIVWRNVNRSPYAGGDIDTSLWVGPHAFAWLAQEPGRVVKQEPSYPAYGDLRHP